MYLLLRRNFSSVEISEELPTIEHVAVKTESGGNWENLPFAKFIDYDRMLQDKVVDYPVRKVACSAWKSSERDSWLYLKKGEYIVGTVWKNHLFIARKDGKPIIEFDEKLADVSSRKLATVTSISEPNS